MLRGIYRSEDPREVRLAESDVVTVVEQLKTSNFHAPLGLVWVRVITGGSLRIMFLKESLWTRIDL